MKIYYVRHGQTDWNLERKMQGGDAENPLNETGIKQAQETQKNLENVNYDLIIRSPMYRVEQTADIINEKRKAPIIIDERLRERKIGVYEGHLITEEIEKNIWDYNLNSEIQGGEDLHTFEKRVLECLQDIKEKYRDKTILIVAHGGIGKILKANVFGFPTSKNLVEIELKNCQILEMEI